MRSAKMIAAAASMIVAGAMAPASAADLVIVAGPGGEFVGYTTPAMVVPAGSSLTLAVVDLATHDVDATTYGSDDNLWCDGIPGPNRIFALGFCPLFESNLIGIGQTTPVHGVSALVPGTYTFFCSIHASMKGTLVVV